jgi:hypothetical protein
MVNGWQQQGSFVIKFFPNTNADGSFSGRIEHVASGQTTRFESPEALLMFLNEILKKIGLDQQGDSPPEGERTKGDC